MIGKKLSPILKEIEDTLWEFEALAAVQPKFTDEGFRAATKIFMAAFMDKMFDKQTKDGTPFPDCCTQAEDIGKAIREIIVEYTGLDMHKLYENP